jgi:hypothetical protein
MATLGRREIAKKNISKSSVVPVVGIAAPAVSLFAIGPVDIQPVSIVGVLPQSPGTPIMREDFITRTEFKLAT